MTLTRRSVLKAGVSVGMSALATPWTSVAVGATRTRYGASSAEGKAMLAKYAKAVGMMKDASKYPPTDPRSWNFQWYTHWVPGPQAPWSAVAQAKDAKIQQVFAGKPPNDPGRLLAEAMWDDCQAHGTNPSDPNFFQRLYFCVWHRSYVYQFEEIVRAVLQDSTFTLPYWDYLSGNVADLSIPPEFRDTASPLYRDDRNAWVNAGERMDKQNPGALNLKALDEPTYIDTPKGSVGFCPILDGNPHGLVHVFVGRATNMGAVPYAANDPIFWLHHCNIDRIWESWNRRPGRVNPTWPDRLFPFADGQGNRVDLAPAGANRTALLNYEYDSYYASGPAPGRSTTEGRAESLPTNVTKAYAEAPVTLGTERARVRLAPAAGLRSSTPSAVFAMSSPARGLYLVLGDISAPADAASTYNVFLDLPESVTAAGPGHAHYVGTVHFFGAAGHDQHGSEHRFAFNVTSSVNALMARSALTATPTVTLVRHGEPERQKPTVGQVLLIES